MVSMDLAKVQMGVQEELGSEWEVTVRTVSKNNGVDLTGVVCRKDGHSCAPTVYLEGIVAQDDEGAIKEIARKAREELKETHFASDRMLDWENIKNRVCYRLVNWDRNAKKLEIVPHKRFLDLAVTYAVVIDLDGKGEMGAYEISNEHLERMGRSVEDIEAVAAQNTPRLLPARAIGLSQVILGDIMDGHEHGSGTFDVGGEPMVACTNSGKHYGASVVLYDGLLAELAKQMGDDLFIIPSSVHEVIALPMSFFEETRLIRESIMQINASDVINETEYLSDNLYIYRRDTDEMTVFVDIC